MEESSKIYVFRVHLTGIKPQIWRRIQMPQDSNFEDLHLVIQTAFSWANSHCHHFRIKNPKTGDTDIIKNPEQSGVDFMWQRFMNLGGKKPFLEEAIKISDYFTKPQDFAKYLYDFGDKWEHYVVLEEIVPAKPDKVYPRCVNGKRSAPPDDIGGIPGYEDFLKIISNPNHKEYKERMQWLCEIGKGDFGPEKFDITATNNAIYYRAMPSTTCIEMQDRMLMAHAMRDNISSHYQFKITLKDSSPLIWRRIQVLDYLMDHFERIIRNCMGWMKSHSSKLTVENVLVAKNKHIKDYFTKTGDKAIYLFDFVQKWEHEVILEKIGTSNPDQKYPRCLAGVGACPPEGVEGIEKYNKIREVLSNPDHPEYLKTKAYMKKIGAENFDPKELNMSRINRYLNVEGFKCCIQ